VLLLVLVLWVQQQQQLGCLRVRLQEQQLGCLRVRLQERLGRQQVGLQRQRVGQVGTLLLLQMRMRMIGMWTCPLQTP
jgi:hypothetical protein